MRVRQDRELSASRRRRRPAEGRLKSRRMWSMRRSPCRAAERGGGARLARHRARLSYGHGARMQQLQRGSGRRPGAPVERRRVGGTRKACPPRCSHRPGHRWHAELD
eukprot:scaffold923_cov256-Pinguiococcus_pyrenoidosus.AAC.48